MIAGMKIDCLFNLDFEEKGYAAVDTCRPCAVSLDCTGAIHE